MIGGLTTPLDVSAIVQVPPAIVITNYFGYSGGYHTYTSLQPKHGYWVKTNAPGNLILNAQSITPASSHVGNQGFSSLSEANP